MHFPHKEPETFAPTLTEADNVWKSLVRLQEMMMNLKFLCEALRQDPILVPTGQQKPRVRVRYVTHPQRSYQDVQNELAVQLANLPRFTAYASIQGEQHQFRLHPPVEGDLDEARIERIRQASKARFGRGVGSPEPPAAPGTPAQLPSPPTTPAGLRIAREHPDEE